MSSIPSSIPAIARPATEDDITREVTRRTEATPDPRFREIMLLMLKHLHAFIKEANITEQEWWKGIQFLTDVGHITDHERQEWILLSDVLGVSMVVDLLSNRKPAGATESTVFGPFHREGAPELPNGASIVAADRHGMPTIVSGRVLDMQGKPIAGAKLDVWHAAADGLYDVQDTSIKGTNMRGKFTTDAEGRFWLRTTRPVMYQIPSDGPVGKMLALTGRHPWRPAHVHFVVAADGYEPVTTHIFDSIDPYLDGDAVFGVKDSLICEFKEHTTVDEDAQRFGVEPPFCTASYDFVLPPAKGGK